MTPRSTTAEEHLEIAITLLAQAEREFLAGDIIQGSEKLWGAASHAMLAAAKQRGWATGSHRATVDAWLKNEANPCWKAGSLSLNGSTCGSTTLPASIRLPPTGTHRTAMRWWPSLST